MEDVSSSRVSAIEYVYNENFNFSVAVNHAVWNENQGLISHASKSAYPIKIHWDWRKSFVFEKTWLMSSQKQQKIK